MDLFIVLVTVAGLGIMFELLYVHGAVTKCNNTLTQQRDSMSKLAKRIDRDNSVFYLQQQPSKFVALERLKSLRKKN